MYKIKLTSRYNNKPLIIYFNEGLVVSVNSDRGTEYSIIVDGKHNNGGWEVKESQKQVEKLIDEAIAIKNLGSI